MCNFCARSHPECNLIHLRPMVRQGGGRPAAGAATIDKTGFVRRPPIAGAPAVRPGGRRLKCTTPHWIFGSSETRGKLPQGIPSRSWRKLPAVWPPRRLPVRRPSPATTAALAPPVSTCPAGTPWLAPCLFCQFAPSDVGNTEDSDHY